MSGNFAKPLVIALEMAGYEFCRRSKNSHLIYKKPGAPQITFPARIEDVNLFYRVRKSIIDPSNG